MKKLILGIVIGLILGGGVALANHEAHRLRLPKPIYRFSCQDNHSACSYVEVFDDLNNKCYIAHSPHDNHVSISCVKR